MAENQVIAISGTPGTGKTSFAKTLAKKLDAEIIDLNKVIEKSGAYEIDSEGTRSIDPEDLSEEFKKILPSKEKVVVDGLLSHLLPSDRITQVVVLRTHPDVLEKRLKRRNFSGEKLRENLEAEALGVILWEAVDAHGKSKVYEIDTTEMGASDAVKKFVNAFERGESLGPGKVDWLEDFF